MYDIELTPKIKHYISIIFEICRDSSVARITDIARKVGVSKSNVSNIIRYLTDKGVVNYKPYGFVTIANTFLKEAELLFEMKKAFQGFLQHELSLPYEIAQRNACAVFYLNDAIIIKRMQEMFEHKKECRKHDNGRIQWTENDEIICPF